MVSGEKWLAGLRFLSRVLALTLLVLAIVGALAVLLPKNRNQHAPEVKTKAPLVRPIKREHLRKDSSTIDH